jgi:hypothetical protein
MPSIGRWCIHIDPWNGRVHWNLDSYTLTRGKSILSRNCVIRADHLCAIDPEKNSFRLMSHCLAGNSFSVLHSTKKTPTDLHRLWSPNSFSAGLQNACLSRNSYTTHIRALMVFPCIFNLPHACLPLKQACVFWLAYPQLHVGRGCVSLREISIICWAEKSQSINREDEQEEPFNSIQMSLVWIKTNWGIQIVSN